MSEYIFDMSDVLYNMDTGEAIFKPKVVGEVVRCKDCKYLSRITSQVKVGEWFGCLNDKGLACCVKLDDYCSYGERGDSDDE